MKVTQIKLRVKRDVRHAPYQVSQCEAELTAALESEEDLEAAYKELHEDVLVIVEEMVATESMAYKLREKK